MTRRESSAGFALVLAMIALTPAGADAQDPQAGLANAQSEAASARTDISTAEARVSAAQGELAPVAEQAEQASQRAEAALERVDQLEEQMVERRVEAADEVAAIQARHEDDVADHDQGTDTAIGLAIAFLLLGLIALGWEQFRSLAPVRWLADQSHGRAAIALVLIFFLLALIGGALVGAEGAGRIAGGAIVVFAFGLVIALLIARHSLLRERGEAQAILTRGRLPRTAALALALLLALIFAGSLGSALVSDEPEQPDGPAKLTQLADAAKDDPAEPATRAVRQAAEAAQPLVVKAENLDDARREAEQRVEEAKDTLVAAQGRLAQAEREARHFTELIAKQVAAAEREAERQARIDAREAREAAQAQAPAPAIGAPSDVVNCEDTAQTNFPTPPGDPNNLDGDNDGIACET